MTRTRPDPKAFYLVQVVYLSNPFPERNDMHPELSFSEIMFPCAMGNTRKLFPDYTGLKYIGNKLPVIRLPKV